jgi:hypothetical protein
MEPQKTPTKEGIFFPPPSSSQDGSIDVPRRQGFHGMPAPFHSGTASSITRLLIYWGGQNQLGFHKLASLPCHAERADGKALVAAKIREGVYKVGMIGRLGRGSGPRHRGAAQRGGGHGGGGGLRSTSYEYCSNLAGMRKARHKACSGPSGLSLIHDLAASAISDRSRLCP